MNWSYMIISIIFAWIPAILIGIFPLISSDSYYVFNFNSLMVQNDGNMKIFNILTGSYA